MIQKIGFLALAGAVGTLSRFGLSELFGKIAGNSLPWGTIAVNLVGCFLAGFLWVLFENKITIPKETQVLIFVGFMGAFTTFSSLILETGKFAQSAQWMKVFLNLLLQNGVGFVALFSGMALGKVV
jgi:fluoride exporter